MIFFSKLCNINYAVIITKYLNKSLGNIGVRAASFVKKHSIISAAFRDLW